MMRPKNELGNNTIELLRCYRRGIFFASRKLRQGGKNE